MRLYQRKASSHTGYDSTLNVAIRYPVLQFALATSFLALHPAFNGHLFDDGVRTFALGHVSTSRAVCLKDFVHGVAFSDRHRTRDSSPTKTPRRRPSGTTTPLTAADNEANSGTIVCASLLSTGIGAALVLGSYGQGGSAAGREPSEHGGGDREESFSSSNGARMPPSDGPNDPFGTRSGVGTAPTSNPRGSHGCDAGGSPPPPPPSGCGTGDEMSKPPPSTVDWMTFVMFLPYILNKSRFGRKVKELSRSGPLTLAAPLPITGSPSVPILTVSDITVHHTLFHPSCDSLDDFITEESNHFSSPSVTSILDTHSPPPATVKIWLVSGARTVAAVFYKPLPTSPNVLLLRENTMCSIDDEPTLGNILLMLPSMLISSMKSLVLSILKPTVHLLHTLFTIFTCGTAAWLVSLVTQSGSDHEAEPEDIDGASLSRFVTTIDSTKSPVAFVPAEFYGVPEFGPPSFLYCHPVAKDPTFPYIFGLFVPTEPQAVNEVKPTDHHFAIPGIEVPGETAIVTEPSPTIEDSEDPLNVNAPLRGHDPPAPVFDTASYRIVEFSRPELSSIPVYETTHLDRRRPRRSTNAGHLQHNNVTFGGYSRAQC